MEDDDVIFVDDVPASAPSNKSSKSVKAEKGSSSAKSPAGTSTEVDTTLTAPSETPTRSRRHGPTKVFPDEKREARYRSAPTTAIMDRIVRAVSQRMYLVSQEDKSTEGNLWRKYAVLGSTGNVYEVHIKKVPMCSCPDFERGNLCKHVLFVMLKVLRVNQNSPLIYQKALLQSEIYSMFEKAPDPLAAVRATAAVVDAYNKATGIDVAEAKDADEEISKGAADEAKEVDGDCPICFECMKGSKEPVDDCKTCRNCIHRDCLQQWLRRSKTCPYCRSDWAGAGAGSATKAKASREGQYLNLGSLQGQSTTRDTSTYRKRSRYDYDYDRERGDY